MTNDNISFYPVIQLLTGPPGLTRNGGIWKIVKRELHNITDPTNIMVQAMHMTNYSLSSKSWKKWMEESNGRTLLANEIDKVFGNRANVFVDSGGFQLMYNNVIDLSKWELGVTPEDILSLQSRYSPDKIASLDYPLSNKATYDDFKKSQKRGIDNISYLIDNYETLCHIPTPYFVVHGRNEVEIETFLKKLSKVIEVKKPNKFGIALGSQVPLNTNPAMILRNIRYILKWMEYNTADSVPLHIFGIGEAIVGEINREKKITRPFSFDNSTSVQKGYRLKIYDQKLKSYVSYNPYDYVCECPACKILHSLGEETIITALSKKSYNADSKLDVTKSDIYALITLHNIGYWEDRVENIRPSKLKNSDRQGVNNVCKSKVERNYEFPLRSFSNNSPNLILLACSKTRPYKNSQSHKRVINYLNNCGYRENIDFDRVTLSGLYGPVFWEDETDIRVMNYDFQLNSLVGDAHRRMLRMRTATVLNVIGKRYRRIVAYLPAKQYRETFEPTLKEFDAVLAQDYSDLSDALNC